ncbi:MAG: hypothetical protein KGI39_02695 [Patescibacteria group bacterium]|nr:hypothetical protein [Patescibacteria group bacterium]
MARKNHWRAHKIPAPRMKKNILKLLKRTERSRGFWTEERFLRAIENANGNAPCWFKGVSKSTKEEDGKGIDFIVHTVFGNIFIQIKSSEIGAIIFKKRKNKNLRIIILVIKIDYDEEKIRDMSFSAIQEEIDSLKKPFES